MKNFFVFLLFGMVSVNSYSISEYSIYGTNEFLFIYRSMNDDYQEQYDDNYKLNVENRFQLRYLDETMQAGLKFNLLRPKYEAFPTTAYDTNAEENEFYLEEFYLHFDTEYLTFRQGTFDAVIGSGITLHNYYDQDVDEDTSLRGAYLNVFHSIFNSQFFFGFMKHELETYRNDDKYDQIGAADLEFTITDFLQFGAGYANHRKNQSLDANAEDDYLGRHIVSGRTTINTSFVEMYSEYAHSNDDDSQKADAFYSSVSAYIGKFTLLTAYKNYRNFNFYISDLPTANHSEEPLHVATEPGYDEEGLLGEIRFIPNYENEYILSLAEAWNSDKSLKMADYFASYKRDFAMGSITAEYSHLEQWKKNTNWYQEITPHLGFDYYHNVVPITLKLEYVMKEEANRAEKKSHEEPKIQLDVAYKNYSVSFSGTTQIGDSFDADDGDVWLAVEFAAYIFQHTDIRLFIGKEKAGKVCRNGVCKFQPEFDGARLLITTTF